MLTYSTDNLGYNRLLVKTSLFQEITDAASVENETSTKQEIANVFTDPVSPASISSGELNGNLNIVGGYLQSSNFVSGVNGYRFDAVGNLEANTGIFRGSIYATTGTIGGWTIDSTKLSQDNTYISSTGYISFGDTPPTDYGDNVGIWLGYDTAPKISLYYDTNNYLKWSGTELTIKGANFELDSSGNITANGGVIGGFTITSQELYGGIIKTGASAGQVGADGVIMDTDGLRGYSSTYGEVFNLPTNGDPPVFTEGIVQNTIMYTNSFAGGDITGTVITGGILRTAFSGRRIEINSGGIQAINGTLGVSYGDESDVAYKYGGSTRFYGTGVLVYFNNSDIKVPLYVNQEQTVADIHLYNRSAAPSGKAEIGDLAVVNNELTICTSAGTPGTFTVVGTQS